MHKATIVIALLMLTGCAGRAAPEQWTHWVCDSGAEVFWRFVDDDREQVEVRLAAAQEIHRLRQEPAGSGALYSDGRLSLHVRGEEGLVYWTANDDLIGRGCKAP